MNTPKQPPDHDEPEITQEDSVPLDDTDPEGEAMMKEVRNDRLKVPPGEEKA